MRMARWGYAFRRALRGWVVPTLALFVSTYIAIAIVAPPLQWPLETLGFQVPAVPRYEISGVVRQPDGVAIPGANVQVGGYRTQTDAAGAYSLRFPAKATNRIPLVVSLPPQREVLVFIDMGAESSSTLDVTVP